MKQNEETKTELVEMIQCKVCGEKVVLPQATPIVGQSSTDASVAQFSYAFANALMVHMSRKHKDIQAPAMVWTGMFSEFYILSMFHVEHSPLMRQMADLKRIQLLRGLMRSMNDAELGDVVRDEIQNPTGIVAFAELLRARYEEFGIAKELEAAGFKLANGFMTEKPPQSILKA